MIIRTSVGCALEAHGAPPSPSCVPIQDQGTNLYAMWEAIDGSPYTPVQVMSSEEDFESETTESDAYQS